MNRNKVCVQRMFGRNKFKIKFSKMPVFCISVRPIFFSFVKRGKIKIKRMPWAILPVCRKDSMQSYAQKKS